MSKVDNYTTNATDMNITIADIVDAHKRLTGVAHKTPVLTSRTIDRLVNSQVFFKCENFQRAGAFKFRGAYNALSKIWV